MPTIYKLAIRPVNMVVPMATLSAGTANNQTNVSAVGGTTNPPSVTSVQVAAYDDMTVYSSPFVGGTHVHSDWEIDEDGGDWTTPVASSYDDTTNKLSWNTTADLANDATLQARVRHNDSVNGDGDWSGAFSFIHKPDNEPAGMTFHIAHDGSFVTSTGGWLATTGQNVTQAVLDGAGDPSGNSKAVRITYPNGETGGNGTNWMGNENNWMGKNIMYYRMYVRPSTNFRGHNIGSKLGYFGSNSGGGFCNEFYWLMQGTTSDLVLTCWNQWVGGNRTGTFSINYDDSENNISPGYSNALVVRGQWNKIEVVVHANTTPTALDGKLYYWLNGVQLVSYDTGTHEKRAFYEYDLNRGMKTDFIWGGGGDQVTEDMYIDWDGIYMSGKNF